MSRLLIALIYCQLGLSLSLALGGERRWKDRLISQLETRNFTGEE